MNLICTGSGSKGNGYILQAKNETLLIEAGTHLKRTKEALNFDLKNVKGCLVSHSHKDHSKHIIDLMQLGVKIYTNESTLQSQDLKPSYRAEIIKHNDLIQIGGFKIKCFELRHDVPILGFLINHKESGNIVFATDTYYLPYVFSDIQHYIIEANYSNKILDSNVKGGKLPEFVRNRILKSHMSLDTTKKFLKASDLTQVRNIILIHLSGGNADPKQFKKEIEQLTYKNTFIASKGLKIELNKEMF